MSSTFVMKWFRVLVSCWCFFSIAVMCLFVVVKVNFVFNTNIK